MELRGPGPQEVGFDVNAPAAILIDAETGQVLFEKSADTTVHPASIAKIMTMLVTMDAVKQGYVSLKDPVRVSRNAEAMGGSQVYLVAGETFPLEKMMRAIAIASANDAAVAVAEHVAGTVGAFVTLMNQKAKDLGMTHTHFVNPDGLPPDTGPDPNVTTAREVAIMARALITQYPEVLQWTSVRRETFRENPLLIMDNTNHLLGAIEGVDGLKTGYTTDAGYSVAATAQRDGRRLVAVVMKTDSDQTRVSQTASLLEFGFRAYRPAVAALAEEKVGELRLRGAQPGAVPVKAARTLTVLTLGGRSDGLTRQVVWKPGLKPPIPEGQEVGWVVASMKGTPLARVPVVTTGAVRPASGLSRLWIWLRDLVSGVVVAAR
ncbi:MAG: D-alanyl-D-alanine carboxypeptidase [Limnochordaceae bacterium]|nr:D-alanyl-D-alanine carboxypeptidase [Limnochordaceae bacterium]